MFKVKFLSYVGTEGVNDDFIQQKCYKKKLDQCLCLLVTRQLRPWIFFFLSSYLQTGGRNLQDLVCTLGNRRKFEEVQRCFDIIGFSHEVSETAIWFTKLTFMRCKNPSIIFWSAKCLLNNVKIWSCTLQEVSQLFSVLAAIIHLGDIRFTEDESVSHLSDKSMVSNPQVLLIGMDGEIKIKN